MANINKLRSKMAEHGTTAFIQELADVLQISRTSASNKLNEKTAFKESEIATLAKKYEMTPEDIKTIFIR